MQEVDSQVTEVNFMEIHAISLEELKARINAAGFTPDDQSLREMQAAWPHFQAMRARLRRDYSYADEPASFFSLESGA
ncbi:hypothetical protein HPQ64_00760 [Rhizobiales bacterium]|uniref:hypothetical protein n=1 Tax=Hongsoonwoonella zoysiae TaxID=2821844 RepID=UPI00155FC05E|nr:hypothetical protein [Hongsoonwoonella zoysiae]NRG16213.1 hypothetical protein [Hongsoonwoonella zoysiae]